MCGSAAIRIPEPMVLRKLIPDRVKMTDMPRSLDTFLPTKSLEVGTDRMTRPSSCTEQESADEDTVIFSAILKAVMLTCF